MSIVILKPGLLETIQDLGRFGFGNLGINPGGAMDHFATSVANIITGNEVQESIIEIHFPGPRILFEKDAMISITGADFSPYLHDEPLPLWRTILVRKNTVLLFMGPNKGARCYLAVHGGFAIDKWLNSYSTNLKAGAGGLHGRKLQKGDVLPFRKGKINPAQLFSKNDIFELLPWRPNIGNTYTDASRLRFIKGNEWGNLSEESKRALDENAFTIRRSSDRMGYHLSGEPLTGNFPTDLVSRAVSFGTMQLLPDGQIILLMADHQTTGGYPAIGHVITAHLPKLAQLGAGSTVQFSPVNLHIAEETYFHQQRELQILKRSCEERLIQLYASC